MFRAHTYLPTLRLVTPSSSNGHHKPSSAVVGFGRASHSLFVKAAKQEAISNVALRDG